MSFCSYLLKPVNSTETVYGPGNTRVRAAHARVAELERQLRTLSGRGEGEENQDLGPGQLYPSLRRLPLLGVTYADLYRRLKVREAVYEVLTKQYELAKVQEAREIPTVKVLDQPTLPEKKAFPPRIVIVILGTILTILLIAVGAAQAAPPLFQDDFRQDRGWPVTDPSRPSGILAMSRCSSPGTLAR